MMDDADKTQEWVMDDLQDLLRQINECEKRYQTLIETNLYGVQVIDIQGKITYVNAIQCDILNYSVGELEGMEIWNLLASESDRKSLTEYLTKLAQEKQAPYSWSGNYIKGNQKNIHLQTNWTCMRNEQGNVTGFIAFTTGVAGQKTSQVAMRQLQEQKKKEIYQNIIKSAKEMVLVTDSTGKITYVNERGAELIGYFEDELLDMNIGDILSPDQLKKLKRKGSGTYELEFINRNSRLLPMEISVSLISENPEISDHLIVARDLTIKKKAEREILKACKFEAVSVFANGIIHDLNNFLTRITENIDAAQTDSDPQGKAYKKLSDTRQICKDLKELSWQLVSFSRSGILNKKTGSLVSLIRDIANLVATAPDITCETSVPNNLWHVEFDEEDIRMLMTHVIINACEAMPFGGKIRIVGKNITVTSKEENEPVLIRPGKYVKISIQDQGTGITKENLNKIFDPYFTTKETAPGKGVGMGLTFAYAAIRKHNGYILADSKPGVQTIIHIYLPV